MAMRRRQTSERGSAAVEFALVLPLLMLLLFGIIDFGRMLNAEITLTTAAREGARATSLFGADAGADRVADASGDLDPAPTATITPCPADPEADDDATVEVAYEFSFVTPINVIVGLGGSDGTITLTAMSVMPCLG
jgi:Flp pilus assembly protein TadG